MCNVFFGFPQNMSRSIQTQITSEESSFVVPGISLNVALWGKLPTEMLWHRDKHKAEKSYFVQQQGSEYGRTPNLLKVCR